MPASRTPRLCARSAACVRARPLRAARTSHEPSAAGLQSHLSCPARRVRGRASGPPPPPAHPGNPADSASMGGIAYRERRCDSRSSLDRARQHPAPAAREILDGSYDKNTVSRETLEGREACDAGSSVVGQFVIRARLRFNAAHWATHQVSDYATPATTPSECPTSKKSAPLPGPITSPQSSQYLFG
jgi:hypothetical protein